MRIRWTAPALAELEEIERSIGATSPRNAALIVLRILERVERLAKFPRSGAIVVEYQSEEVREVYEAPYRIIYRIEPEIVEIVTIVHGRRRLRRST